MSTNRSKAPKVLRRYRGKGLRGEIHWGDALAFLRQLENASAHLIFLDPPFNLGKAYDPTKPKADRRPAAEYWRWMELILGECVRVLREGGALYLYHLPLWAVRLGAPLSRRLELRHWIAVSMKNGFVRGRRLYPAHYGLLYFTKGEPQTFSRPKVKARVCHHCKRTVKDYGGYKDIIARKGINLSDIWEDLSPVRHSQTKLRQQNQLPLSLTERVIAISGRKGGVLVDPFAGSGSVVVAAAKAGMVFKACDIVKANCVLTEKRLASLLSATRKKAE